MTVLALLFRHWLWWVLGAVWVVWMAWSRTYLAGALADRRHRRRLPGRRGRLLVGPSSRRSADGGRPQPADSAAQPPAASPCLPGLPPAAARRPASVESWGHARVTRGPGARVLPHGAPRVAAIRGVDVVLAKALKTQQSEPSELCRPAHHRRDPAGQDDRHRRRPTRGGGLLHVIVHFGHDGWVLWHDVAPEGLQRAGDATLMARVRLDDGVRLRSDGCRSVEGTHGPYRAACGGRAGCGEARPRPDGSGRSTRPSSRAILAGRQQADQGAAAGSDSARRHRQRLLRRDPARRADLTADPCREPLRDEVERLCEATRTTLTDATAARRGVPPSELRAAKHAALRVHRRPGAVCPVCGDTIREFTFSGAAAQYCPTCQTGGAPAPRPERHTGGARLGLTA